MPRIVRFAAADGTPKYGVIDGADVRVISPHPFAPHSTTGEVVPIAGLRLLAPVIPTKVVCVGRNYAAHAKELGSSISDADLPTEPLLFLKPSSAVIGPGEPILLPTDLSSEVHHEAELAIVIGALLQRVSPADALKGIFGFTCANDVTARDLQRDEPQWTRGKGFDSFLPLGPAISTDIDPRNVSVRCLVDGELRQDGNTKDMLFDVATIVSYISQVMTLLPSDIILTGTPAGVGPILPGQTVRVEIAGIGALENPVIDRMAASRAATSEPSA